METLKVIILQLIKLWQKERNIAIQKAYKYAIQKAYEYKNY